MSHPLEPASRIGRVRAFYEANPDEELSVDDIRTKFDLRHVNAAYKIVHYLRRSGFIVSVGRRPTVYRRALP